MLKNIIKTTRYIRQGNNFVVEVTCTPRKGYPDLGIPGEMIWCLYVIIGKGHPLYNKACANTTDYDCDLGDELYDAWHGGCTYYKKNMDSVKMGCDYHHLGDEEYYKSMSEEIPEGIAADFDDLYDFFNEASSNATCDKQEEHQNGEKIKYLLTFILKNVNNIN